MQCALQNMVLKYILWLMIVEYLACIVIIYYGPAAWTYNVPIIAFHSVDSMYMCVCVMCMYVLYT